MRGARRFFCPPEWDVNLFIPGVGGRGAGGEAAVQGLFCGSASVCLFVCLSVCLRVCPGCVGGWSGSEFRGKDRTKRFRRARSTKSEREVGSDSLILTTPTLLIVWKSRHLTADPCGNPVRGCVRAVGHFNFRAGAQRCECFLIG